MSTAEQTPERGEDAAAPDTIAIAPHDLFVSYAHADVAFAVRLRDALSDRGKTAWVDESGIRPNERWREALDRAVEEAAAVLFIVSPDSLASPFCRAELEHAAQHGKRIISVAHRAVDMDAVPAQAAEYQFIPARGRFEDAFAANLALLLEAIDTDLDWLRATTRWEQKALEWDRARRDDSFLLSGAELEEAESYLAGQSGHRPEPTPLQGEFVLLSRRRQTARLRRTRAATTTALVIVSALAVLALILRQQSVTNAHVATSRQYAAQGVAALSSDPNLSVLYAVRALGVQDTAQAEAALRRAAPAVQLLSTLTPGGSLTDVAYSADGTRLVTASRTGVATVYDVASGRRLARLREPAAGGLGSQNFSLAGNGLTAAALSADGRLVATASLDTTARVWDVATGRQLEVFPAPRGATLNDVAFNSDASELVTANENGNAEIFQPGSPRPIRTVAEPRTQPLLTAVFSADGRRLLTASSDGTARIWDAATGAQEHVLAEPGGQPLADAEFSADGRRVVTASVDGTARIWDAGTGRQLVVLGASSGSNLQTARFSPGGQEVVTAGSGPTVTVWDAATGEQLTLLHEPLGPRITSAGFSPDGRRVLTGSTDGTARVWAAFPRQLSAALRSPDGASVGAVATGPAGRVAFADDAGSAVITGAGAGPGTVVLHEGTRGPNVANAGNGINSIAFSPDAGQVLTASQDGTARLWDAATGRLLVSADVAEAPVLAARFLPGGGFVTVDNSGAITRYDARGRQLAQCTDPSRLSPIQMAVAPSGTAIALAGVDGTARVLALPATPCNRVSTDVDRQLGLVREPLGSAIGSVQFSADGRRLLTASNDGTARLWNWRTGAQDLIVRDPAGSRLYGAALSPDGSDVAIADGAGTATVFAAGSGRQLTSVGYAAGGRLTALAYTRDGRQLVTGGFDGRVSVWSAQLAAPLGAVRRIALSRVRSAVPGAELSSYQRVIR